jgi:hypothetical protein
MLYFSAGGVSSSAGRASPSRTRAAKNKNANPRPTRIHGLEFALFVFRVDGRVAAIEGDALLRASALKRQTRQRQRQFLNLR